MSFKGSGDNTFVIPIGARLKFVTQDIIRIISVRSGKSLFLYYLKKLLILYYSTIAYTTNYIDLLLQSETHLRRAILVAVDNVVVTHP
jgi:hypothetical protein